MRDVLAVALLLVAAGLAVGAVVSVDAGPTLLGLAVMVALAGLTAAERRA